MGGSAPAHKIVTTEWLEEEFEAITGCIKATLEVACPLTRISNKMKEQKFWTKDLQKLRTEARKARKAALRTGNEAEALAWADKQAEFRRAVRKAKKNPGKNLPVRRQIRSR